MMYIQTLCIALLISCMGVFAESQETRKVLETEVKLPQIPVVKGDFPKLSYAEPQLESQVNGGALYTMGKQKLLVLAGDPYTIGYAHGQLLAGGVRRNMERVTAFAKHRGRYDELKEAWARIKPFMPERYLQELKGLADGSGMPLEEVQIVNIFPALFHCSGFAIFGKATKSGELYHGRVLDYMTALDFQKDAVTLLVKSGKYNTFINVGYAGLLGSVTGMNDKQVAIGEMGGGGRGLWDGLAMSFLVRKALEEGSTLQEAVDIFRNTKRTCEYFYVISDGKITDARGLYGTPDEFMVIKPGEYIEFKGIKFQEPVDGVLMSGPPRLWFLSKFVENGYGKFTAKSAINLMNRSVAMQSNLHDALFIPARLQMYAAHAADPKKVKTFQACYQTYQFYDVNKLLPLLKEVQDKSECKKSAPDEKSGK